MWPGLLLCALLLGSGLAQPRLPSEAPRLPSEAPRLPSEAPQLPSKAPRLPSDSEAPQLPSEHNKQHLALNSGQQDTILKALAAVTSQLSDLRSRQDAIEHRLDDILRRQGPYPTCEVVTVARGRQFRLVGDAACGRGRLQWRIQGYALWHQLCDRTDWTQQDAMVACRALGFDEGTPGVHGDLFGASADGHARAIGITCAGWEDHLWECKLEGESRHSDGCPAGTTPVSVTCRNG